MPKEIVMLYTNHDGEPDEISSNEILHEALTAYRDAMIEFDDLDTGVNRARLTVTHVMISDLETEFPNLKS